MEHRQEMEQIAEHIVQKQVAEIIPEIQREAYQSAMRDLLTALEFDVQTVVEVAFENGERIFRDSKTQKVIAKKIMQQIKKHLSDSFR